MSIIPVVTAWERFVNIKPCESLHEFAKWILAETRASSETENPTNQKLENNGRAAQLIADLHKIMVIRTKPVLKSLGLVNEYEFSILYQVRLHKNANKKTICQILLIEGSTGIEIIKRLIKNGFLYESTDSNDRRSKTLTLSPLGEQVIEKGYELLSQLDLYQEFLTPLVQKDSDIFLDSLQKLNNFHKWT